VGLYASEELERVWKEEVVAYYFKLRKTTKYVTKNGGLESGTFRERSGSGDPSKASTG
jgi:hypothetical protein